MTWANAALASLPPLSVLLMARAGVLEPKPGDEGIFYGGLVFIIVLAWTLALVVEIRRRRIRGR